MMMNSEWYQALNKPVLTPPDWIFAPAWSVLYILMAVSLYFYIKTPSNRNKIPALTLFFIQLLLNFLWMPVFFAARQIELAGVICILLLIFVLMLGQMFYEVSKLAAYLLIPYFLWLCYAAYLNIEIVRLNS